MHGQYTGLIATTVVLCSGKAGAQMEEAGAEEGPQAKQPKLEPAAEATGAQQQAAAEADASGAAAAASGVGDAGGSLSDMPALSQRM